MIFLFVCSTPPRRRLWLHHAVRSLLERRLSELRATFPMKVSCHVEIFFSMLGISTHFLLTVSFVMCLYFTSDMLMPDMCQMLLCRHTSIFFRRDVRSNQLSHPHSNRLAGMARKTRYLLRLSTLASAQNLERAPIDAFPDSRRA